MLFGVGGVGSVLWGGRLGFALAGRVHEASPLEKYFVIGTGSGKVAGAAAAA